jgi:hypothetical protein
LAELSDVGKGKDTLSRRAFVLATVSAIIAWAE